MGKSQRTKGAVYEREISDIFSNHFLRPFKRNIGQARDGGNDLDVGCLVVEAKRRATLKTLRGWMEQAVVAADARFKRAYQKAHGSAPAFGYRVTNEHIPIVVCREDGVAESLVILSMNDFLDLAGDTVESRLGDARVA